MSLLDAIAGTPNASQPLPWLVTAGQPGEAQFAAAKAAGITTVIDLRDPMEARPFDEAATLARLGIAYRNIPVNAGSLDDATMAAVLAALREAAGTPTMLHCASAWPSSWIVSACPRMPSAAIRTSSPGAKGSASALPGP